MDIPYMIQSATGNFVGIDEAPLSSNHARTLRQTGRTLKAVCVDVIDLGRCSTSWGVKNRIKFVFETEELKPNGYRRCASRTHNVSYYWKGRLRQDLQSWIGRPLSPMELLNGFELASLVGRACILEVADADTIAGQPYLQIQAIRKPGKDGLSPSGEYRRWENPASPPNAANGKHDERKTASSPNDINEEPFATSDQDLEPSVEAGMSEAA